MKLAVQLFFWVVGIPLQLMTLQALLRGWYRRFPFVFVYMVASFLATAIEVPTTGAGLLRKAGIISKQVAPQTPATYYWLNEVALQVLMFALVINLIYSATSRLRSRKILRAALIGAPVVYAAIALAVEHRPGVVMGEWMTPWLRDLSISSTVLDLLLWALLIASRRKDYKVLMLSGALGIQFTGEAIGSALRSLAVETRSLPLAYTGTILFALADMTCLFLWWQIFREKPPEKKGGDELASPQRRAG